MNTTLLEGLNPRQFEAIVDTLKEPALVIAGAGSGKTGVLTRRAAFLIEQGVSPHQIMLVTFTVKASNEIKERIAKYIGHKKCKQITMGTFHSIAIRILKQFPDLLPYKNFTIFDESDARSLIKKCAAQLSFDFDNDLVKSISSTISFLKNDLISPSSYYARLTDSNSFEYKVYQIYNLYQQELANQHAYDFDDLIMKTVMLIRNHQEVKDYCHAKFQYIMVDEFQDCNASQYEFARLMKGKNTNLLCVGDDNQSIYAFRGSNINIILGFKNDFPNAKIVYLDQNYRSSSTIVDASTGLINNNPSPYNKKLFSDSNAGDKIQIVKAYSSQQEARYIATKINQYVMLGHQHSDIAILYRTSAVTKDIENTFMQASIPYQMHNNVSFFDRVEIKDILSFIKISINPYDDISFKRLLNFWPGLGKTTINKLSEYASHISVSLYQGSKSVPKLRGQASALLKEINDFVDLLNQYSNMFTISEMVNFILKQLKYKESLTEESRIENIDEFINYTSNFYDEDGNNSVESFLTHISVLQDSVTEEKNAVHLMTIHASKGLEFPVVFIVGMEEGIFPSIHCASVFDYQEERRLAYVAMTRAKTLLHMTYSQNRMIYGRLQSNKPSRFIDEIPKEFVHHYQLNN